MANTVALRTVTMGTEDQLDRYQVHIRVNRPVYTRQDFDQRYTNNESAKEPGPDDKKQSVSTVFDGLRHCIKAKCSPPSLNSTKKSLLSFFPFIRIMQNYNVRSDLPSDIMSGLIVGIMHIPQGRLLSSCNVISKSC